jgi:two-component system, NtrC family, C4-dicarboxylate transport sensor histidine kinase DctB
MRYFSESNIGKFNFMGSVALILLLTFFIGGYHIISSYKELEADIQFMEENFKEQQKEYLKAAVNEQISRIEVRQELVLQNLKKVLKTRNKNILGVMDNLYNKHKENRSREEIQKFIYNALQPLSFHGGGSYVFIVSMEGIPQLYPPKPSLERQAPNLHTAPDRQKVVTELIKIVKDRGKGFYEYQWPDPTEELNNQNKKICFVSYFEPFDWFVAIVEYLDHFTAKTQQRIRLVLNQSNQPFLGSYFFLYRLNDIHGGDNFATMLVNPNRPDLEGKMISDSYTDVTGFLFRKEMLQGIREKGEAYVEYHYKKPKTGKISRKLSYFKLYPKWNWILARGVYFDDLEKSIEVKKKLLAKKVQHDVVLFLFLLAAALTGALFFAIFFSGEITSIFEQYKKRQKSLQNKLQNSHNELELLVQERTVELEQSHAQLLHAEKLAAVGSFSASIAHEFNNPLTGVLNVLVRLQRKVELQKHDAQLLTMALKECERMTRLIQDLQSFNRPSSGKNSIFVLEDTIESILLLSKKELTKHQIRVEKHYSHVSTLINGVEDQIKQVILNLLKNSAEAIPDPGGIITISTEQKSKNCLLTIHDTGTGISLEEIGSIFEPFFTTKTAVKGTGLGLSVSHGIIKSNGGKIEVHSEPGKGTTFVVTLPIHVNQTNKESKYGSKENTSD